ncbi:MAG: hypothetical protein V1659_01475 [Candidatus Woesearchaeota archaeon]
MADEVSEESFSEYELLPHQEIIRLRKEIEQIKKNPFGDTDSSRSLLSTMEQLNQNLEAFLKIMQDSRQDILEEYEKSNPSKRLDQLADQNEKIAKALLAVAEIAKGIKDDINNLQQPAQQPPKPNFPPPPPPIMQQRTFSQQPMQNQPQRPNINPQGFNRPYPANPSLNQNSFGDLPPLPPIQNTGANPDQQFSPGEFSDIPALGDLPPFPAEPPKKKGLFGR